MAFSQQNRQLPSQSNKILKFPKKHWPFWQTLCKTHQIFQNPSSFGMSSRRFYPRPIDQLVRFGVLIFSWTRGLELHESTMLLGLIYTYLQTSLYSYLRPSFLLLYNAENVIGLTSNKLNRIMQITGPNPYESQNIPIRSFRNESRKWTFFRTYVRGVLNDVGCQKLSIKEITQFYIAIPNMSRSQPYRSKMPVEILRTLDVASRITLFLVGQSGPLSFTFKDRLDNKYKTSIGADLKCSCSLSRNDHCIHTLYIMLKIFRVSPQNPVIWQAAYVDSELSDLVAGKYTVQANRRIARPVFQELEQNFISDLPSDFLSKKRRERAFSFPESKAERMKLNEDSVCPICQEEMTEDQSLSYCRIKCGNNFHLQCLKVWGEHKSTTETAITCPMCRSPFGDNFLDQLRQQQKEHKKKTSNKIKIKFKCSGCGVDQIPKGVHKCLLCTSYELCEACYHSNKHIKHPFIRQLEDDSQRWCGGQERREDELKMKRFIDNKRKQKNVNEQLIEKLRKVQQDPSKLLDFAASAYPYVSKYISDNVDPYKKLDLNPEDMKCMKCFSKKMLFLRRLTCGHFIDHECLKQNLRKGKFHCEQCGGKILKGYQNLIIKQKELQRQREQMIEVSDEFNPKRMEKKTEENYNFVLPQEATLADILGGRVRDTHQNPDENESRLRQRLASNLVRGSEVLNTFRNQQPQVRGRHQSTTVYQNRDQSQQGNKNNLRIRNIVRQTNEESGQHRSVSRNGSRKQGNKKNREDMGMMLQAMIGRKVF